MPMYDDWVAQAATEICIQFLAEPCREVDEDGNVCAWYIDAEDKAGIAAIIRRFAPACECGSYSRGR
jgi:hypothetical protein